MTAVRKVAIAGSGVAGLAAADWDRLAMLAKNVEGGWMPSGATRAFRTASAEPTT